MKSGSGGVRRVRLTVSVVLVLGMVAGPVVGPAGASPGDPNNFEASPINQGVLRGFGSDPKTSSFLHDTGRAVDGPESVNGVGGFELEPLDLSLVEDVPLDLGMSGPGSQLPNETPANQEPVSTRWASIFPSDVPVAQSLNFAVELDEFTGARPATAPGSEVQVAVVGPVLQLLGPALLAGAAVVGAVGQQTGQPTEAYTGVLRSDESDDPTRGNGTPVSGDSPQSPESAGDQPDPDGTEVSSDESAGAPQSPDGDPRPPKRYRTRDFFPEYPANDDSLEGKLADEQRKLAEEQRKLAEEQRRREFDEEIERAIAVVEQQELHHQPSKLDETRAAWRRQGRMLEGNRRDSRELLFMGVVVIFVSTLIKSGLEWIRTQQEERQHNLRMQTE